VILNEYFGQAKSGSLKIRCEQLKPTWVEYVERQDDWRLFIKDKDGSVREIGYYNTPEVGGFQAADQLFFMLIENRDREDNNGSTPARISGLLLQSAGKKGE